MNSDTSQMLECIELANQAALRGELPFASILTDGSGKVFRSGNTVVAEQDVVAHAEMNVIREAQKEFGDDLSAFTLYSNCEPCAMCSFMICELGVSRVVFGVASPEMGGYSRWHILNNEQPIVLRGYGFSAPEVMPNFMSEEASKSFLEFNRPLPGLPWSRED